MKRIILIALIPIMLSGCAWFKKQIVFFNDSDKIMADDAKKGVCEKTSYPCVVMSKGMYRKLTDVNGIKTVEVVDCSQCK